MWNRHVMQWLILMVLFVVGSVRPTRADDAAPPPSRAQVEADWLRQDAVRDCGPVTPEQDAAGACDGVKNGKWGFHTALENDPWWQIDLGETKPLDHLAIYNRCDHTAGRAAQLTVLLSADGKAFEACYRHDGTAFLGQPDGKPLQFPCAGKSARYVRLQVPGKNCLHLDEVEIVAAGASDNVALGRPATQSSVCEWSTRKDISQVGSYLTSAVIQQGLRLAANLQRLEQFKSGNALASASIPSVSINDSIRTLEQIQTAVEQLPAAATEAERRDLHFRARTVVRQLALANPLLDFDDLVLVRGAPGKWSHMSDQYLGWWSQPGGGLYVLHDFKTDHPQLQCLTDSFPPGNVLRPDLSYDGRTILFAWCKNYPGLSEWPDKLDKSRLPEDSFYHLFEVNVDGTGLRQLTFGKYNDFDGRYLPNGEILFCSTRRGQAIQCSPDSAAATLANPQLPESYVRCGGGPDRPCAVYTMHVIDAEGQQLRPISAFEMFEWTPSVDDQGRIIYSRWDYVDRFGQNNMGLWSTLPDGTGVQAIYGNFTRNPECFFEARSIPGSRRLIFTAAGHHSISAGSLVLLDPRLGPDAPAALTRLTPEVCFPESEGRPTTYYANPFPLSEEHFLVAWSDRPLRFQGETNETAALGVYLYDAFGNLTLLYRDPAMGSQYPLPIRPRPRPPVVGNQAAKEFAEARMLLLNVYAGLTDVAPGSIKRLRVVGLPVKTHPTMDSPSLGVTTHDNGRYVLGTVPVEPDGSAWFRVPAGVTFYMQALDEAGMAVQTMRSGVYLQPSQTQTCIGCHEPRATAPANHVALAVRREPSLLTPGPEGSWPLDYATLVQPVLDRQCMPCHKPGTDGAAFDLTAAHSYDTMVGYGTPSLKELVIQRYREQRSVVGQCEASMNPVLKLLKQGHYDVSLNADDGSRLITWMDTLGQRSGSFSPEQEQQLRKFREQLAELLAGPVETPAGR
ncbi:MAG: HzsA-related protein [Pirellulaceae bacterium]